MDSNKDSRRTDELRERRHEEALARRMAEALDRISGQEATECPGADVIAAYHERSLGIEEAAQCEGHFAACARCRKILAVLTASQDAPLAENEVARLGELVAGTMRSPGNTNPQKIESIRPSRWDWRVRWLAPALGMAAVLTIWFVERPPWRTIGQESSGTLVAQAPKSEVPPSTQLEDLDRLSKSTPQRDQKSAIPMSRDHSHVDRPMPVAPENPLAGPSPDGDSAMGRTSPNADVATNSVRTEDKLQNSPDGNGVVAPAAPPPPPPAAKAEAETEQAMAPQNGRDGDVNSRSATSDKIARAPQPAAGMMVAPQSSDRVTTNDQNIRNFSALKSSAASTILIKSPSGSTIWRAGIRGMIQCSTDAGHTYIEQTSPSPEDWLAGAAVSDKVGWLAGRDGTIARTMDAEHWERVAPPSQLTDSATKLPDWMGITARDAQNATITAQDGRRFTTQDGGKSWQSE